MSLKPREKRHQRTRNDILNAARKIVNEQGIDKLSMRRLAKQIDYSPAGLYEYFDSKESIILAVCEQGHERLANYLGTVNLDLAPDDYLLELGLTYIRFALENPDFYLMMFTYRPSKDGVDEKVENYPTYITLLTAVQKGIEVGLFRTNETQGLGSITYAAWSLVHGISMLRLTLLKDYAADFEPSDRAALSAFIRGIKSL